MSSDGWLKWLPASWEVRPAKALFTERREPGRADDPHLTPSQLYGVLPQSEYMERTGGQVVLSNSAPESMKRVQPDDFIIHLRSFQGGLECSTLPGRVSPAYTVLTPTPLADPRFFRWLFKSSAYVQELRTTTNQLRDGQAIGYRDFARVALPTPPPSMQHKIADYLDRETAQIDTLIAKQEQLVSLLHERRRVASAEILVPTDELPPQRLKRCVAEVDARAGAESDVLPLLSVSISWGIRRRDSTTDRPIAAHDLSLYKVVRAGELVINRMRAFQGALAASDENGMVSPDYAVLKTAKNLEPRWLAATMRTPWFIGEMSRRLKGIGGTSGGMVRTPRINVADLLDISIPIPSLHEQHRQLAYLDEQTAKIDALIAKAERFIELAKERRAALITAAVTGQLDVTAA